MLTADGASCFFCFDVMPLENHSAGYAILAHTSLDQNKKSTQNSLEKPVEDGPTVMDLIESQTQIPNGQTTFVNKIQTDITETQDDNDIPETNQFDIPETNQFEDVLQASRSCDCRAVTRKEMAVLFAMQEERLLNILKATLVESKQQKLAAPVEQQKLRAASIANKAEQGVPGTPVRFRTLSQNLSSPAFDQQTNTAKRMRSEALSPPTSEEKPSEKFRKVTHKKKPTITRPAAPVVTGTNRTRESGTSNTGGASHRKNGLSDAEKPSLLKPYGWNFAEEPPEADKNNPIFYESRRLKSTMNAVKSIHVNTKNITLADSGFRDVNTVASEISNTDQVLSVGGACMTVYAEALKYISPPNLNIQSVTIVLGHNDLTHHRKEAERRAREEALAREVKVAFPNAKIAVVAPFNAPKLVKIRADIEGYCTLLTEVFLPIGATLHAPLEIEGLSFDRPGLHITNPERIALQLNVIRRARGIALCRVVRQSVGAPLRQLESKRAAFRPAPEPKTNAWVPERSDPEPPVIIGESAQDQEGAKKIFLKIMSNLFAQSLGSVDGQITT